MLYELREMIYTVKHMHPNFIHGNFMGISSYTCFFITYKYLMFRRISSVFEVKKYSLEIFLHYHNFYQFAKVFPTNGNFLSMRPERHTKIFKSITHSSSSI